MIHNIMTEMKQLLSFCMICTYNDRVLLQIGENYHDINYHSVSACTCIIHLISP